MKKLKVLVACEESQTVCKAFRALGHEAYSNDIQDCSGGHPEWHLKMDSMKALQSQEWDLVIAHPPCTYLTVTGNRWFKPEYKHLYPDRIENRIDAVRFFNMFTDCAKYIAIENPVGIMSTIYRKPDQIIQPYHFGHTEAKKTCLWLKGLPKLKHTEIKEPEYITYASGKRMAKWYADAYRLPKKERQKLRSKTFQGIADAMASQWSEYILSQV